MAKITDVLSPEELAIVTNKNDLLGAWMVASQWLMVAGIFWFVATWTNPVTLLLGTVLLGGRLLGFGILSHECGHKTLFRTRQLNEIVGDWLVAAPNFSNNAAYMRGHLQHHRLAGTEDDPDLKNYRDYPITRERLRRKLTRDITGQTGWRTLKGIGKSIANFSRLNDEQRAVLVRALVIHAALIMSLAWFGVAYLYLMWVAALVFVQPLISRIRQVAEHAAVPDLYDLDPRKNTRTVIAGPLARLVFAPHRVNYHLEHHMLASVPAYRLKTLHEILTRNGYYDGVDFPQGYVELLKRVTVSEPSVTPA